MQYDKRQSDESESESSADLGAVAGLIIGIFLGSLILNTPGQDPSGHPTAKAYAVGSDNALRNS